LGAKVLENRENGEEDQVKGCWLDERSAGPAFPQLGTQSSLGMSDKSAGNRMDQGPCATVVSKRLPCIRQGKDA